MSKTKYVKAQEAKKKEKHTDKPLMANHRMLMFTIVAVVATSSLIGFGFAYMGYTSGYYSEAYGICKENILSYARMGAYPSVDEVTVALKSCEGVTN
jgi:hypothetical protein